MTRRVRMVWLATALLALGWLGWSAFQPVGVSAPAVTDIRLWTHGATAAAKESKGETLALADAIEAPAGARRVPDVAFIRRAYPALRHVTILGDGLAPADAAALAGIALDWERPPAAAGKPALDYLSVPRVLPVGQRFQVEGSLTGLPTTGGITLSLENPDGTISTAEIKPSAEGKAGFSLVGTVAVAPGRYEWKLRLGPRAEPLELGVMVVPTWHPRTLLLGASPNAEFARLQRWLAEAGAPVTSRTRVSTERFRFAAANDAPAEFDELSPSVLEKFDVVVTTPAGLLGLSPTERGNLESAVRGQGLGIVLAGASAGPGLEPFFEFGPPSAEAPVVERELEQRVARLRLADGRSIDEPVGVLFGEIPRLPLMRPLARDSQGRTLSAAISRGHGWVARSLVIETWKWLQAGQPEAYATYWSQVLSTIARRGAGAEGEWLVESEGLPRFVGERVAVSWHGPTEGTRDANVTAGQGGAPIPLNLARGGSDPATAEGNFWPDRPGWYVVRENTGGVSTAFYAQPADVLEELRAGGKRRATARAVAAAPAHSTVARATGRSHASADRSRLEQIAFALFLLSAGMLWLGERRAVG